MNKGNNFFELLYGWIGFPFVLGYWVLGGISYFWAVIIALKEWGLGGAFVTFILPVVGQIFWTYKTWKLHSFNSNFILVSLGALACYLLSIIFIRLSAKHVER